MIRHLYIHIPFCHRICPYCAFYKHLPGRADSRGFVEVLAQELAWAAGRWEVVPETVAVGGGTPSILPGPIWSELVRLMREAVRFDSVEEWTMEANPRTFNRKKAESWRETGVTRVSLGVQSLDGAVLQILGRDHGREDAVRGAGILREAGFEDVNFDLMFGVPGQTMASWVETLETAISLGPSHVSAYNLTYEEDTEFLRNLSSGRWQQDPDEDARFFAVAHERLVAAGFEHYEISNYAKPGFRSRHNQAYWRGADYLGIGPSAVSTIEGVRFANWSDTARYRQQVSVEGHGSCGREELTGEERRLERLALGLRTLEGIPAGWIDEDRLGDLLAEGLAERVGERLRLTLAGMMVADEIAGYLI